MTRRELARHLWALRWRAQLPQLDAAIRVGVTVRTIRNWEGARVAPRASVVQRYVVLLATLRGPWASSPAYVEGCEYPRGEEAWERRSDCIGYAVCRRRALRRVHEHKRKRAPWFEQLLLEEAVSSVPGPP